LIVESKFVMLFKVGDDFIWIEIAVLKFLVVTATLKSVSSLDKLGHFLVKFVDPK